MRLDGLELPINLFWENEFSFIAVAQESQRTVTGGMDVQAVPLAYGQPVRLTGAWATRLEILALKALENEAGVKRILTLNDGTEHTVLFDVAAGGVQAPLLFPDNVPIDETQYLLTLNFMTVEPDPVSVP